MESSPRLNSVWYDALASFFNKTRGKDVFFFLIPELHPMNQLLDDVYFYPFFPLPPIPMNIPDGS